MRANDGLAILFWFYKDPAVCENRLDILARHNGDVPISAFVHPCYVGPRHLTNPPRFAAKRARPDD